MAKHIKLAKLIGWPLVAAVPFVFGINYAYAKVGVASAVNGEPRSKQPNEVERVLHIGNDMVSEEVVKTGERDRAHIVFLDGSTLTVGPNSQITIDKFVYDADRKTGVISLEAGRGVFRYVGGAISKTSEVTVKTPAATMGIRGGIGVFSVNANGDTTAGFLFGKSLMVTAQGVTKVTNRVGTQITVPNGSPPNDPAPIPPNNFQEIDQQLTAGPLSTSPTGPSISGAMTDSTLAQQNSNISPVDAKNAIEGTQQAQNQVHSDPEKQQAFNIQQGAGPLEGSGPLQGSGPIQGTEPQQGSSPLQTAGPMENSGPLESSGPLQAAGPLQNAGPLAAATPVQQVGPVMGGDINLAGTQPGMNIPYVPTQDANFIPYLPSIGFNNQNSMQQLQAFLDSPQGSNSNSLTTVVNSISSTSYTPTSTTTVTPLPPVIFNPSTSSNVSPN